MVEAFILPICHVLQNVQTLSIRNALDVPETFRNGKFAVGLADLYVVFSHAEAPKVRITDALVVLVVPSVDQDFIFVNFAEPASVVVDDAWRFHDCPLVRLQAVALHSFFTHLHYEVFDDEGNVLASPFAWFESFHLL